MIGRIHGKLIDKSPPTVTVDAHGVGYDIEVPMSTFYQLPATGENVTLLTHLVVREDAHLLYGFASDGERTAFRQLLKISGIGARIALAVLSGLSVDELSRAIATQEAGRLVKIPGIGKKTAERLLLELRDKLPKLGGTPNYSRGDTAPNAATPATTQQDILGALLALGYNEREALVAMRDLPADAPVAEGIRHALRQLSKA